MRASSFAKLLTIYQTRRKSLISGVVRLPEGALAKYDSRFLTYSLRNAPVSPTRCSDITNNSTVCTNVAQETIECE